MARAPGAGPDDDRRTLVSAIGRNIRHIRRGRLSIEELARRADTSAGGVSLLENGRGNPSVETLRRLAAALEVELSDLLDVPTRVTRPTQIVRSAERPRRHAAHSEKLVELLTPGLLHEFTVSLFRLEAGEAFESRLDAHGAKAIFHVLAGTIEIAVGTELFELGPHDTLLLQVDGRRRVRNSGTEQAEIVTVFHPGGS
jgi:transcriptional regulator with XRE-family HTH domain